MNPTTGVLLLTNRAELLAGDNRILPSYRKLKKKNDQFSLICDKRVIQTWLSFKYNNLARKLFCSYFQYLESVKRFNSNFSYLSKKYLSRNLFIIQALLAERKE